MLHTRVPDLLEKELKRLATSMRMPVSNVVRAILEDAVETVDTVGRKAEGEVRGIAERLGDRLRTTARKLDGQGEPEPRDEGANVDSFEDDSISESDGRPPLYGVVGYQSMLLAKSAPCAVCGRELAEGSESFLCIRGEPGPRAIVGPECMPLPARERGSMKT